MTRQLSLIVDLFLEPGRKHLLERIVYLVKQNNKAADIELRAYILEAMRVRGITPGLPRIAAQDNILRDGKKRVDFKTGDTIVASLAKAHMDPEVFAEPDALRPDRPAAGYALVGCAPYISFGNELMMPAMLGVIKEVFALPGLRRSEYNGKLVKVSEKMP